MQITIIGLGKIKDQAINDLIENYQQKIQTISPKLHITWKQISDPDPTKKVNPTTLLNKLKLDSKKTLFLAEWGKQQTTSQFEIYITKKWEDAEDITIVTGNAWGWEQTADYQYLSLSTMTFNHELAQLMLWEQLYRFADFTRGGKYTK